MRRSLKYFQQTIFPKSSTGHQQDILTKDTTEIKKKSIKMKNLPKSIKPLPEKQISIKIHQDYKF